MTVATVISISSALAVPVDRPCPETRNGKPQSRAKTLDAELGREVRPQPQPGPRLAPGEPQRAGDGAHLELLAVVVGVRRVAHDEDEHDAEDDADGGGGGEGRGPAPGGQGQRQRRRGREGAQLAQHPGDLGDHRGPARREPQGDEPQQADEDHGVAHPDEDAGHDALRERARRRRSRAGRRSSG